MLTHTEDVAFSKHMVGGEHYDDKIQQNVYTFSRLNSK